MRSLVTGGAGFIGSHIVDRLLARGDDVCVIDDLSSGSRSNLPPEVYLQTLDIASTDASIAVADLRPDRVIHCAAQASVAVSVREPARDALANIVGSIHVIEGAKAAGAHRFVYVNTGGALYAHPRRVPSDESEAVVPVSPYGLSKATVERYLALLSPSEAWWCSVRLANVYGPRQSADGEAGVVSIFIERVLLGQPIEIHGDGGQTRDFVYVEDVAEAVELAADHPGHGVVNIGSGTLTSINELVGTLARVTQIQPAVRHVQPRKGDIRVSALDASRAAAWLGWVPRTGLDAGLEGTIAWRRGPEPVAR